MDLTKLQGKNDFSETDFATLLFSNASKNGQFVINLNSLEKRLYTYLDSMNQKTALPLTIIEEEKRVDLSKSISFLATIGAITCYSTVDESINCAIFIDEPQAEDIINSYSITEKEKCIMIKEIADHIYPSKKSDTKNSQK